MCAYVYARARRRGIVAHCVCTLRLYALMHKHNFNDLDARRLAARVVRALRGAYDYTAICVRYTRKIPLKSSISAWNGNM